MGDWRVRVPVPRLVLQLAVAAVLTALLAACGGASSGPSGAGGSGATATPSSTAPVLRTFAPFTSNGTLTVAVAARRTGSCFSTSVAVPRADAYRCLAGNSIEDPCFASPVATSPPTVACVPAPWDEATVLTVTGTLPAASGVRLADDPWALQLANGARCVASTGTVPSVGAMSLNYVCGPGVDAGIIQVSGSPDEVSYGSPSAGSLTTVAITTIWSG